MRRPASARGAQSLVGVLMLLLLVLTALVAIGGSAQFGAARLGGLVQGPLFQLDPRAALEQSSAPEPPLQEVTGLPGWLPVLMVLLVSVLLALLVRSLARMAAPEPASTPQPPAVGSDEADADGVVIGQLQRVLGDSAARLRAPGADAEDVVVRCWESLEEHGGRLGTPRPAHQTSSEFSADLLRRNGAEAAPVRDLLALYHRARFGSAQMPPGAAARAATDLESIAASLHRAVAPGDGLRQVPRA